MNVIMAADTHTASCTQASAHSPSAFDLATVNLHYFFLMEGIFLKIIYLFICERPRERDMHTHPHTPTHRGRSRLHAGSLMWDLIPGLQDHTLGQRRC